MLLLLFEAFVQEFVATCRDVTPSLPQPLETLRCLIYVATWIPTVASACSLSLSLAHLGTGVAQRLTVGSSIGRSLDMKLHSRDEGFRSQSCGVRLAGRDLAHSEGSHLFLSSIG